MEHRDWYDKRDAHRCFLISFCYVVKCCFIGLKLTRLISYFSRPLPQDHPFRYVYTRYCLCTMAPFPAQFKCKFISIFLVLFKSKRNGSQFNSLLWFGLNAVCLRPIIITSTLALSFNSAMCLRMTTVCLCTDLRREGEGEWGHWRQRNINQYPHLRITIFNL